MESNQRIFAFLGKSRSIFILLILYYGRHNARDLVYNEINSVIVTYINWFTQYRTYMMLYMYIQHVKNKVVIQSLTISFRTE